MASKKRYDVRFAGKSWSFSSKNEAKAAAKEEAVSLGATIRKKVRVYMVAEGQTRGELMYYYWVGRHGLTGEDR